MCGVVFITIADAVMKVCCQPGRTQYSEGAKCRPSFSNDILDPSPFECHTIWKK